jgi:hypothetical protein
VYVVSQQLIAANIERISAVSWEGYQREGRGAVVIDAEAADTLEGAAGPLVYVSDEEAQETGGGWPSEDVTDIVRAYDPENEVIVIVKWRGEVGVYRFKPPTSPPMAHTGLQESWR